MHERWAMLACAGLLTAGAVWGFATVNTKAQAFEASQEAKAAEVSARLHYIAAQVETEPAPTPTPAPVLYDVPLEDELQLFIISECESKNVDPAVVLSMIYRESRFTADVIGDNGNSFGYMQIQPRWWYGKMADLGCTDLLDGKQNVTVGIDILADLLERYEGDYSKALTAYNTGAFRGTVTEYANAVIVKAEALKAGETL